MAVSETLEVVNTYARVIGEFVDYEDVKDMSTAEYFNGNQFSIDAFKRKYTLDPNESYVQAVWRVCTEIASVEETEELRTYWARRWFSEIFNDWWKPAGSIMQGAGSPKSVSLANCTTLSLGFRRPEDEEWDSLEGIIRNTEYAVAKCAAYRQGLGVDFSRLRPRSTSVWNSASESTGAIHWMKKIDSNGYFVGQKGRIPAMLFSLSCSHPDIEEFIRAKSDFSLIQNANISVGMQDGLYEAALAGKEWTLSFEIPEQKKGQKVYVHPNTARPEWIDGKPTLLTDKRGPYYICQKDRPLERIERAVDARALIKLIAQNMRDNAEPGIQNIDIAIRLSNSDYLFDPESEYDTRIISTNACSEQYLSSDSQCFLASINCGKFYADLRAIEDLDVLAVELIHIGESVNRFLDNVNTYEFQQSKFATVQQRMAINQLRRTGAGFTNLVAWLLKAGVAYGTPEGNRLAGEFQRLYNYSLYVSSRDIGRDKGSFGAFNRAKFEQSPFVQRMMDMGIEFDAMRNVTCSSIAPVGTLSLMFRESVLSHGIEPAFGLYYWKRTRIAGFYEYYFCVPRVVRDLFEEAGLHIDIEADTVKDTWDGSIGKPIAKFIDDNKDKLGLVFNRATDITPLAKLDLMRQVMQWCDSSISTTYMLAEDATVDDVYEFIIEAWRTGVKSVAAFPDRKMYGIISYIPFRQLAEELREQDVTIHPQNFTDEELRVLRLTEDTIEERSAPKRPDLLPCDIHHVYVQSKPWVMLVGKLGDRPYEIFGGSAENVHIPKKIEEGWLVKRVTEKKNCYDLYFGDEEDPFIVRDVVATFDNPDHAVLTRMISMSLRHGNPLKYVLEQLSKDPKSTLVSFTRVTRRVLNKYLTDGEPLTVEPGDQEVGYFDPACPSGKCD